VFYGLSLVRQVFSDASLRTLAKAWLAEQGTDNYGEGLAFEQVIDMQSNPEVVWRLVLLMIEESPDELLGNIAAGPLEDLLCHNAPRFIERVEERASRDPRFRRCLGGVWGWTGIPKELWPRLQASGWGPQ
jgi:hypothetical protein